MQQGRGGGGGGHQSQYGEMSGPTTGAVSSSHMVSEQSEQLVEEASPISSRPPATGNLDEFLRLASGGDEGGEDEGDRPGGGAAAAGVASGNRWPRQETLALLKIRSDMDATFRDATVKGPLWEDVSRKLAELGYKRSAKKCKEKFENVHKYYKRTKEGRAGRQDGKSYKFFSQLEALHTTSATAAANLSTSATAASLDVAPVSVGIPMPISSVRIPPTTATPMSFSMLPMPGSAPVTGPVPAAPPVPAPAPPITTTAAAFGIGFSSNSSSSSQGFKDDDDDDEDELGGEPSDMAGTSRKRRRQLSRGGGSTTRRMMEFFEGLMKQVMQKQEAMQQRFLEAIEKREQDRMIREEAWKRQEMARLTREHELMAQERAIAASRDDAIISFLQKITGQTIQLPTTTVTIPTAPPPPTQPAVPVVPPAAPIPAATPSLHQPSSLPQQQQQQQQQRNSQQQQQQRNSQQQQQSQSHHQHQQQQHQPQNTEVVRHHQQPVSSEVLMAIPEQQVPLQEIGGSESLEPASSRWPKDEVLALINLRSGLESRYQEVGPKGPLWEEISAGMFRMGYKRSAKRCKEKWENINKYFKKVKESNKKRPEDAKTCPYFHQLDALYRKKILGGGTSGGSFSDQNRPEEETSQQYQDTNDAPPSTAAPQLTQPTHDQSENKTGATADVLTSKEGLPGSLFGEGNGGAAKKPEDIVRELMEEQGMHQQKHHQGQSLLVDGYDKIDEPDSDNMDHEEDEDEDEDDEDEDDDDDDDELEEERKMAYKIEFQRPNASTPNGGGNGAPSFFAMVQ